MTKRILQLSLVAIIGLLVVAMPVYAISVANAVYVADVVTYNAGTATNNVVAAVPINTQALIDGKYVTSNLLNTALQTPGGSDVPYMPGVGTNPWVFFVPNIGASEQKAYMFYAGGPPMQTGFYYLPSIDFTKLTNPATLPASNGLSAAFTSDGTYLAIAHATTPFVTIYKRSGDTFTKLTNPATLPTGTGRGAAFTSDGTYLAIAHSTTPFVTIYKRSGGMTSSDNDVSLELGNNFQIEQKGYIDTTAENEKNLVYKDAAFRTYISAAQSITSEILGASPKSVTVTNVSSGELIVKTTADGTDMTLSVTNYAGTHQGNSPQVAYSIGAGVPGNGYNWSFITNGSMIYMDYHKIWVGGTAPANLKQHIVYERNTTFNDLTDNNNDATPTFPTISSDPDVTATFQNFRPIKEAVCTTGLTEETPEMLTETPEMPAEFYTEGSVNHLPGAELVNNLLDAGGIPYDLFWIPFCFGLAAATSVLSYYFLRSMFFIAIIGGVIILFFGLTGAIPLWTFLIYVVIAGGVLVSERTFGW